jgi:hypothetical protein
MNQLTTASLNITWDRMSPTQQQNLCQGLRVLGPVEIAQDMVKGASYTGANLDQQTVINWLQMKSQSGCS